MRVLCFVVLLFAGTFNVHAQSVKLDRIEAIDRIHQTDKTRTINDRNVAVGVITPPENYNLIEATATVPGRFGIEFGAQSVLDPFKIPNTQLETVAWSEINGWPVDDHAAAFATFLNSCKVIVRGTPLGRAGQPFYAALQSVCRRAVAAQPRDSAAARIFFEQNFRPMRIAPLGESNGFLTGYYEPNIEGSRVANPEFNVPMDRIREWIEANPKEGKELRRRNKSSVFFRETGLAEHEEPVGAQGVSLTPGRSIAVDRFIHVYGTLFYIEAELPIESEKSADRFQRLMVSQDTGGVIRGTARADLYFGAGDEPTHVAGRIRHPGQFTILIPREIDPVMAGKRTPLPRPRPGFAKVEGRPEITSEMSSPDQKKEAITGRKLEQAANATECPGNPNALGTSRVISVDPTEHARIGTMQYAETLPLADKEVVLTFDDGPLPPYTNRILSTLASECVKATFFIVGSMARAYPNEVRRVYAEGHTIGTHSQNHPMIFDQMPIDRVHQEVETGIAMTAAALGSPKAVAPFFRIPGLARSSSVEAYLRKRELMTWSADFTVDDWTRIQASDLIERAIRRIEAMGRGILLLHDIQPVTALALPSLLNELKARGYRIVHVVPAGIERPKTVTVPQDWIVSRSRQVWPRVVSTKSPVPGPRPRAASTEPASHADMAALGQANSSIVRSICGQASKWRQLDAVTVEFQYCEE